MLETITNVSPAPFFSFFCRRTLQNDVMLAITKTKPRVTRDEVWKMERFAEQYGCVVQKKIEPAPPEVSTLENALLHATNIFCW